MYAYLDGEYTMTSIVYYRIWIFTALLERSTSSKSASVYERDIRKIALPQIGQEV